MPSMKAWKRTMTTDLAIIIAVLIVVNIILIVANNE